MKLNICILLLASTLVLIAPAGPAWAKRKTADDPVVQGALGQRLDAAVQRAGGIDFWGSVLVARDGKVLLAKGYGNADYRSQPNTPRTLFELASISKPITAAAVLHLQQRKKLSVTDTLDRILLDATQPFPQPVREDFHIVEPAVGGPPVSVAVQDWHEEFLTDGWEWVLPDDERFPTLFPPDESLITRNGEPHPWSFSPSPAEHAPHQLWVQFPPIHPGETLDIHKAMLWVGTPGNRIWGDDILDDGNFFDESVISVWEYPTPEPGTCSLLAICMVAGGLMVAGRRSCCQAA